MHILGRLLLSNAWRGVPITYILNHHSFNVKLTPFVTILSVLPFCSFRMRYCYRCESFYSGTELELSAHEKGLQGQRVSLRYFLVSFPAGKSAHVDTMYSRCCVALVQAIVDGHGSSIRAGAQDIEANDDQQRIGSHGDLPLPPRPVTPPLQPDVHVCLEDDADECAEECADQAQKIRKEGDGGNVSSCLYAQEER